MEGLRRFATSCMGANGGTLMISAQHKCRMREEEEGAVGGLEGEVLGHFQGALRGLGKQRRPSSLQHALLQTLASKSYAASKGPEAVPRNGEVRAGTGNVPGEPGMP